MHSSISTAREAHALLRRYFPTTRLVSAPSLSSKSGTVYLKLESDLPPGSLQPRGALYALSVKMGRRQIDEVTACSRGNHGAAVAFAAT